MNPDELFELDVTQAQSLYRAVAFHEILLYTFNHVPGTAYFELALRD